MPVERMAGFGWNVLSHQTTSREFDVGMLPTSKAMLCLIKNAPIVLLCSHHKTTPGVWHRHRVWWKSLPEVLLLKQVRNVYKNIYFDACKSYYENLAKRLEDFCVAFKGDRTDMKAGGENVYREISCISFLNLRGMQYMHCRLNNKLSPAWGLIYFVYIHK